MHPRSGINLQSTILNRFFETPPAPDWQYVIFGLLAAAGVAAVVAVIVARLLKVLLLAVVGADGKLTLKAPVVRTPIRLVRLTVFLVVAAVLTPPALELFGLRPKRGLHLGEVTQWALKGGLRIVIIFVVAFVIVRLVQVLVKRFEAEMSTGTELEVLERVKRARTLGGLVQNVLTAVVVLVAGMMILREVGVDVTPILTSAGILGLAVGFGAQTLVKDIISGFFMILENDVRIGDVVAIGQHSGMVEEMNLRTIVLRDNEGAVHIIPNGSVTSISNRTKDYSYYVIDVPSTYATDTDEVVRILKKLGKELRADHQFTPHILDDIEVMGVDAFTDTAVTIKARIKTMPLKQWEVGRELRRRLKKEFEKAGLEFPHTTKTTVVVSNPEAPPP